MMLDVSVIIPCFNCEKTIRRCLDSIPKGVGVEVILVNDCSTDRTRDEIIQYKNEFPMETITLIENQENSGAGESRNVALSRITRTYLTFVDADDTLSSDFASQIFKELDKPVDCLIFDAMVVSPNDQSVLRMFYTNRIDTHEVEPKQALTYTRPCTWGKLYRSDIIRENGVRFGNLQRNEDLVFTKTALCYCNTVRYLNAPLYLYYINPTSLMNNKALLTEKNAINAVEQIKPVLIQNGFQDEYNSIYFLEVVYSTSMTFVRLGKINKECIEHFKEVDSLYRKRDPYFSKYLIRYRLTYVLFRLHLFCLFRLIV